MPTSLGWRQRGPAHGAPGWGKVSENRWGKVSEKLSRYWGNVSEKRHGAAAGSGAAGAAGVAGRRESEMQVVAFSTPMNPHWRWRIVNYAGEPRRGVERDLSDDRQRRGAGD